jgi:eukaryotic-like serine/threonine-protein kinase
MRNGTARVPLERNGSFDMWMMIGRVLAGRYRLLELLGEGGMAHVFRAHDELLDRAVAVKVLRAGFGADRDFVARFRQEARSVASLHHPNIATVYDTGTDGVDYIVMQLVDGEDLERMIRRLGRIPVHTAARIVVDVSRALQAAHERGIIHRDVKPANILVDRDGEVRVVDFGIARAANAIGVTTAGMMLGSVHYVSPEQVHGEEVTAASDVFSLGVVLYEAITGQRPFDGPTPASIALERLHVRPAPPSSVQRDLPPGLDPLVMRALERDPAARYPSAGDFGAALEAWRIGSLGGVRRRGAVARERRGGMFVAAAVGAAARPVVEHQDAARNGPPPLHTRGDAGPSPDPMAPTARTPRPAPVTRATDRDRRAIAPAFLIPLGAIALVVIAAAAFLRGAGDLGGAVAGATATPRPTAVAVIPPATAMPTREATPSPTPEPTPTPSPTPSPTPTPEPTPKAKPTPESTPDPTPTSRPDPAAPARDPAETVARFYRLVVEDRFDEAAALWTADMRERYPPDGNIDGRFAPTTDIDLVRNEIVAIDPQAGTANVAVDLIEYREAGSSPRRFVGDWDLVLVDGRWLMNDPDF